MYAGIRVILELQPDGTVTIARRRNSVQPKNASRRDLRKILRIANHNIADHRDCLGIDASMTKKLTLDPLVEEQIDKALEFASYYEPYC